MKVVQESILKDERTRDSLCHIKRLLNFSWAETQLLDIISRNNKIRHVQILSQRPKMFAAQAHTTQDE